MQRLILAEKGVATNQCCAVFPWTEFCNSIGGTADENTKKDAMKPKDAASSSFDWFNRDQKERCPMSVSSPTNSGEQALHAALELSKNSWLLAIQLPLSDPVAGPG